MKAGVTFTVHPYDHDPQTTSYGLEAVAALGVDPRRVFKTLLALVDGSPTVAVVPVAGQLDLKALANAVGGKKAEMMDPAAAQRMTGYVVGGISPLGQRKRLTTIVDSTSVEFATVFVSGGKRGLDIELSAQELVRLTQGRTAPIGRPS